MSRYAMEWAKQLHGHDPEVRLVMFVLADDAQGCDHKLRSYEDRLEKEAGLATGEADAAVRRAQAAGLLAVTETFGTAWNVIGKRRIRDFRLLIPSTWRTQASPRPKGESSDLDDVPTAVYRLYNTAGELVYVGISDQPDVRFKQHEATQIWWREVVTREITWHESRRSAEAEEERVINQEDPLYNDDSPGRYRRKQAESKTRRYIIANKAFSRFTAFLDALTADMSAGKYHQRLMPEVEKLASLYATDTSTVIRSLRYLVSAGVLNAVDEERYERVKYWGYS